MNPGLLSIGGGVSEESIQRGHLGKVFENISFLMTF